MSKFARLKGLKIRADVTARFELPEVGEGAVLILAPASEGNKGLLNATLANSKKNGRSRKGQTAATLKADRNSDRELYAKHVAKGWEKVNDESGDEVEFSFENVKDLFFALPDDVFDEIRIFALNVVNYRDDIEVEEIAGN